MVTLYSCLYRASVVSKILLLFQLMHTIIKIIEYILITNFCALIIIYS